MNKTIILEPFMPEHKVPVSGVKREYRQSRVKCEKLHWPTTGSEPQCYEMMFEIKWNERLFDGCNGLFGLWMEL